MGVDSEPRAQAGIPSFTSSSPVALAGAIGLLAYIAAVIGVQPYLWNVVTYAVERRPGVPHRLASGMFAALLTIAPILCALFGSRRRQGRVRVSNTLACFRPLVLSLPLAVAVWFDTGLRFPFSLLHMCGAGWSVLLSLRGSNARGLQSGGSAGTSVLLTNGDRMGTRTPVMAALVSLTLVVAVLTLVHTRLQINFFEHFMLGHADMGHFTEELKNALAGRGLRSDSFPNTRLGWHFTPLEYLLVPGYWLWPSPVFLMVCSALFVHITALPLFWLAHRVSGSTATAWLFALAWLLHPSVSRLPYSGTYGFQWLYITLPLMVWWIGAGLLDRWKTFFVLFVVLLLCRETTAATTLGVGLYLLVTKEHRIAGAVTVVVSVVYAIVCFSWIIPHFAVSGEYERMQMFGVLGSNFTDVFLSAITQPTVFWGRFVRYESILFVCTLMATLLFLPVRAWRLSLAALPALVLVLLLDNGQWLSIKFWYQVSVLPVWFVAAMVWCARKDRAYCSKGGSEFRSNRCIEGKDDSVIPANSTLKPNAAGYLKTDDGIGRCVGKHGLRYGWAVLLCCGWGHYLLGFSPIAKSYDLYAADLRLQQTDPAFRTVEAWRNKIPKSATILATERLAAHFTDYRRIYTGGRPMPADFVLIDPRDAWDTSGLPEQVETYRNDPSYRLFAEANGLVAFERLPDARVVPKD